MEQDLLQYIVEQEHRQDIVGDLGRWVIDHAGEAPDISSLAFQLAREEFDSVNHRTRKGAVEYMERHREFQRILQIEPRLQELVRRAMNTKVQRGYSFAVAYFQFKQEASRLVGYDAERQDLRNAGTYDITMDVISFLLPMDVATEEYRWAIDKYDLDV
jgi:hypothetical protein